MKSWKVFGNSLLDQDIHYMGIVDLPFYPTYTDVLSCMNRLTKVHSISKENLISHDTAKVIFRSGRIEVTEKDTGVLYYLLIPTT